MTDFEVHPIGTADRIEALERELSSGSFYKETDIDALPSVTVGMPDDHALLALMLATEEMHNVQGWFRKWTTGDYPVSAWADDPDLAGTYRDAMERLPDFKAAFLAALPAVTAPQGVDGWHIDEMPMGGVLIYSLKDDRLRNGKPIKVNDVTIRVEAGNGSTTDIGPIASRILAALALKCGGGSNA